MTPEFNLFRNWVCSYCSGNGFILRRKQMYGDLGSLEYRVCKICKGKGTFFTGRNKVKKVRDDDIKKQQEAHHLRIEKLYENDKD